MLPNFKITEDRKTSTVQGKFSFLPVSQRNLIKHRKNITKRNLLLQDDKGRNQTKYKNKKRYTSIWYLSNHIYKKTVHITSSFYSMHSKTRNDCHRNWRFKHWIVCSHSPSSLRTPRRMHVQPVEDSIEINRLPTLLHPLNHAGNMVTPESHAYQLLNQFIVRMVAKEL